MITRFVPSCPGPRASDLDDAGSHATRGVRVATTTTAATNTPEDILRQARATSLAGIFNQIAAVAEHSFEIFNELKDESTRLGERFQRIQTRVSTIATIIATANGSEQRDRLIATKMPSREESDAVLAIPEFSFSHTFRHPALAEAYAKCEPMPALELVRRDDQSFLMNPVSLPNLQRTNLGLYRHLQIPTIPKRRGYLPTFLPATEAGIKETEGDCWCPRRRDVREALNNEEEELMPPPLRVRSWPSIRPAG